MHTARLPTVSVLVATTRCQWQGVGMSIGLAASEVDISQRGVSIPKQGTGNVGIQGGKYTRGGTLGIPGGGMGAQTPPPDMGPGIFIAPPTPARGQNDCRKLCIPVITVVGVNKIEQNHWFRSTNFQYVSSGKVVQ